MVQFVSTRRRCCFAEDHMVLFGCLFFYIVILYGQGLICFNNRWLMNIPACSNFVPPFTMLCPQKPLTWHIKFDLLAQCNMVFLSLGMFRWYLFLSELRVGRMAAPLADDQQRPIPTSLAPCVVNLSIPSIIIVISNNSRCRLWPAVEMLMGHISVRLVDHRGGQFCPNCCHSVSVNLAFFSVLPHTLWHTS